MSTKPDASIRMIFLPRPRRSWHPYQWSVMLGLHVYAIANLLLGPASHSPLLLVQGPNNTLVNLCLWFGTGCCLSAMIVHDNLWRLIVELAGHLLLITTSVSFADIAGQSFLDARHADGVNGLSLNLVMFSCITVAAISRSFEIGKTIRRTWFRPGNSGAIVETHDRAKPRAI